MFVCASILICSAISSAVGSVLRPVAYNQTCRDSEFKCLDGSCISANLICDKFLDCSDGSDEESCLSTTNLFNLLRNVTTEEDRLGRFKRQYSCPKGKWQCRDGSCINSDEKCDGATDCLDGSDETHALCRHTLCPPHLFRCTYGACVDGTAPCDFKVDCADKSDELIPKCRIGAGLTGKGFPCLDGSSTINSADFCDGIRNCPDGSDETVEACGDHKCPGNLFQCAYGACVNRNADCNGERDCADGSDEADDLCNKTMPTPPSKPSVPSRINVDAFQSGKCVLPAYPQNGKYAVTNAPNAGPGQRLPNAKLFITCQDGYGGIEQQDVFCDDGAWSVPPPLPDCRRLCKLDIHPYVKYTCKVTTAKSEVKRACKEEEPSGTLVTTECDVFYYASSQLPMKCEDGKWNRIVTCHPNCGRMTSTGGALVAGGKPAQRGQLPWHVAIYRKPTTSKPYYEQICGGSIVSKSVVITAAHCFWDPLVRLLPASQFAVAAAKLYRDWNHPKDKDVQKSDIKEIHAPKLFGGGDANYQEDIALLILKTPVVYHSYVAPVCLHFSVHFLNEQLKPDNLGKVAGWGLTGEKTEPSEILNVVDLPYVAEDDCIDRTPITFRESITGDKICAGFMNGTAVCKGDSGGGLVFSAIEQGAPRFYLRGIVSTAPKPESNDKICNIFTVTTFTSIFKHRQLIEEYLIGD